MKNVEKQIIYYTTPDGKCPYLDWLNNLDDKTQSIINARIDRLKDGLRGDWKRLTNSKLSEFRIDYGKGYRIYYRELNNTIILIVAGGDKSDQKRLIKQENHNKSLWFPKGDRAMFFHLLDGFLYKRIDFTIYCSLAAASIFLDGRMIRIISKMMMPVVHRLIG